jgi:hypothetical protein
MTKNRLLKKAITGLFGFIVLMILLAIFKTNWFFAIINIFWFLIFVSALTVIVLGTLTFIGKKQEAKSIINMFLQGSMTAIDLVNFLSLLWKTFVQTAKEAFLFILPYFGIIFAGLIYIVIIYIFKFIGKYFDATVPTILLTVFVTFVAGLLTLRRSTERTLRFSIELRESLSRLKRTFIDSFEVIIFLLFLTIDSTSLFFLPDELNIPVRAKLGSYDLMVPSFVVTDHFGTTLKIIAIVVMLELLRRLLRLAAIFRKYYVQAGAVIDANVDAEQHKERELNPITMKQALKQTVAEVSDDFLMFATFTLFTVLVFIAFPRLKLLTLITASASALLLDLLFRSRLTAQSTDDLLSRIFRKILEINPLTNRASKTV